MAESKSSGGGGKGKSEEEKFAEGKQRNDSILECVQKFCLSEELEEEFGKFLADHMDTFKDALDVQENPLSFYDAYNDYLKRFERKFEDFIEKEGFTSAEFYAECREVLEGSDVFGNKRFFVEIFLATTEYESFLSLMKAEVRAASRK